MTDEPNNGERRFKGKKKPAHWKPRKRSSARTGICCGAFSRRTGRGCRNPPAGPSGRCRMHSGEGNSGPRTPEGKARVGEAQRKAWHDWRRAYGLPESWRYGSTWLSRRKRETAADWLAKNKPDDEQR